jgi:L-fuculose-phosphate aldolase
MTTTAAPSMTARTAGRLGSWLSVRQSSLRDVRDAPNQAFEGAPEALLEIDPAFAPALHLVAPGQDLILLSWLHRADRSVLQTHPRGDPSTP